MRENAAVSSETTRNPYEANQAVNAKYLLFWEETDPEKRTDAFLEFLLSLAARMKEGGTVPAPCVDVTGSLHAAIEQVNPVAGETFQVKDEIRLRMDTMTDGNGDLWLPLFLDREDMENGQVADVTISDILRFGLEREDLQGVVVNPFGHPFTLGKKLLAQFLEDSANWVICKDTRNKEEV